MTNPDHNPHLQEKNNHDHHHGNPFLIPFLLILFFAIIEFYGGIWTKSLALLGDAWHMFSDVFALGLAMYAAHRTNKARKNNRQSRSELIASVLNAMIMLAVIIWIVIEAISRLKNPHGVAGGYVMLIAFLGLVVNLIVAKRMHHHAEHHDGKDNLNHRAAFLHVIGDILGSVAALVAGAVIYYTGWLPIDPILSIFISLLLLLGTFGLIKDIYDTFKGNKILVSHHGHHH